MKRVAMVARNITRNAVLADRLENASSFGAKFMGLMGRRGLGTGDGMWLPDSNGIHMLFMRFPIDAVFVSGPRPGGERHVVAVRHALPAWRGVVWWVRGAKGVLELPAGTAASTGTEVGDEVRLEG